MNCNIDFDLYGKDTERYCFQVHGTIEVQNQPSINDLLRFSFEDGVVDVVKDRTVVNDREIEVAYLKIEHLTCVSDDPHRVVSVMAEDWSEEDPNAVEALAKIFREIFGLYVDDHSTK